MLLCAAMAEVRLGCGCGKLRGVVSGVSPARGCRVVCYCDDCQAFARFLGRPGVLDEWGGTDLFQVAPSSLTVEGDLSALACVRLSNRGMHRWYCGECKTPLGNTLGPRVPFVGLIHSFCDHDAPGQGRDDVLGPPIGHVKTQFATKAVPPERREAALRALGRAARLLSTWWLTGAGAPSPFFDSEGRPRAVPRVLTAEERRAI